MLFRCIFFENGSNNGKVIENEMKKYLIFAMNKGEWVGFSLEVAYYDFRQDEWGYLCLCTMMKPVEKGDDSRTVLSVYHPCSSSFPFLF